MKKLKLVALALGLIGVMSAGNVLAAPGSASTSVSVTAEVVDSCSFTEASYSLAFTDINPVSGTADATATVPITFTCSNGTGWTLGDTSSFATHDFVTKPTGSTLQYALALNTTGTGIGTGSGAEQNVVIKGTIAANGANGYKLAPVGSYSGSTSLAINW